MAAAPSDVATALYHGLAQLPAFNPDDDIDPRPAGAAELRVAVRDADALMFAVPEYAGGMPGAFKNLLDWLIGDDQPGSIYAKPVAWINASTRGARRAHESLRTVLGYAHATIVEEACLHVPVDIAAVDAAGLLEDGALTAPIAVALAILAHAAKPGAV
jgi:NAD(P)H-dependent FMN reductase